MGLAFRPTLFRRALVLAGGLALCLACSPKPYDTEAFSFPPAKDNWKYKGTITYSCAGNPDERNLKTVNIVVEDRAGGVLLDDTMQFKGVEIDARVVWKKASHFTVVIREKGTRGALSRTNYWFDSTKGKFR